MKLGKKKQTTLFRFSVDVRASVSAGASVTREPRALGAQVVVQAAIFSMQIGLHTLTLDRVPASRSLATIAYTHHHTHISSGASHHLRELTDCHTLIHLKSNMLTSSRALDNNRRFNKSWNVRHLVCGDD